MGQAISRRLAGRLEKGMVRHRQLMEEDALKDVAEKRRASGSQFSDPSAIDAGFQRGQGPDSFTEIQQEKYLGQQQKNNMELPDDLIQFLNDAGPLERKVDKEYTSPRLRQKLDLEESEKDRRRQSKDMPIMENSDFATSRTTNFSTLEEEEEDRGLTHQEIHNLLRDQGDNSTIIENEERYLTEKMGEKTREAQLNLVRHTIQYLAIPVLMKETNDNVIGTHADRVHDLERMYKMTAVPEDRIRLVLDVPEEEGSSKA